MAVAHASGATTPAAKITATIALVTRVGDE
jgi:hypothetical protein